MQQHLHVLHYKVPLGYILVVHHQLRYKNRTQDNTRWQTLQFITFRVSKQNSSIGQKESTENNHHLVKVKVLISLGLKYQDKQGCSKGLTKSRNKMEQKRLKSEKIKKETELFPGFPIWRIFLFTTPNFLFIMQTWIHTLTLILWPSITRGKIVSSSALRNSMYTGFVFFTTFFFNSFFTWILTFLNLVLEIIVFPMICTK